MGNAGLPPLRGRERVSSDDRQITLTDSSSNLDPAPAGFFAGNTKPMRCYP